MSVSLETYALAKKYTEAYVAQHGGGGESGEVTPSTVGSITIGSGWVGDSSPYTQSVSASGYIVSPNTCVDLVANDEAVAQMIADGVSQIYISNDEGVLTAHAIGGKTTASLTFQAIYTEVS